MVPFYGWGSTASKLEPLWGGSLFISLSFQKFVVVILLSSEERKAESTSEPPSGFEHRTLELIIQDLNPYAIEVKD